ncbi:hypothetical protein KY363_03635 [Candidatus Woesearchaeota archaeon]|nr:hypothetical protein [Candidatus Woesearchaeota archaeon]
MKRSKTPETLPGLLYSIRSIQERQNHVPPFGIGLFNKRLCGIVMLAEQATIGNEQTNLYYVQSDETEDPLDRKSYRFYRIAGRQRLQVGERIHAYVSRRRYSAEQQGVTAHLIRWYETVSKPGK